MAKKWDDLSTEEKARVLREYAGEWGERAWGDISDEELVANPMLWPEAYDDEGNTADLESQGDVMISELGAGRDMQSSQSRWDKPHQANTAPETREAVSDITGVTVQNSQNYDPLRGVSESDMDSFSGVRPGTVLDPSAYERNAIGTQALGLTASERANLGQRDANRFAIDANGLPVVDPMLIANPDAIRASTINAEQTNTRGAFDGTQRQVGQAQSTVESIMGRDGTRGMMAAGDMARAAAEGRAPSAAEQMYLGAGADAATAYDRIAQQAAIESRNKANALRMQQNAMAAGQRGAVSGLANLQAMNNSALGEAQLYQQALDAQQRANIEATGAMTQAQYQAAAARASEMEGARALYAEIETQLRAGNIQAAAELSKLAGITLSAEGQVLGVNQANTEATNAARTQNAANDLIAQQSTATNQIAVGQANASNDLSAQTTNAGNTVNVLQGNQSTALGATAQDDAARQAYDAMILAEAERDRQAAILATQNQQETVDKQADRLANVYTGNMTTSAQLTAGREAAQAQQNAALVGTAGAIVGGVIAGAPGAAAGGAGGSAAGRELSDERSKTVTGPAPTPDFRAAAAPQQYQVAPTAIPQDSGQLANQLATPQLSSQRGDRNAAPASGQQANANSYQQSVTSPYQSTAVPAATPQLSAQRGDRNAVPAAGQQSNANSYQQAVTSPYQPAASVAPQQSTNVSSYQQAVTSPYQPTQTQPQVNSQPSNYNSYQAAVRAPFTPAQQPANPYQQSWSNMRVSQPSAMRPPPVGSQAQQLNAMTGNYAPPVPPKDFRRARDERYLYNGDPTRTQYTGPMAQQLPTNVQTPGPGGQRYVDTGRLAMNLASAVGDLQRKLGV